MVLPFSPSKILELFHLELPKPNFPNCRDFFSSTDPVPNGEQRLP